MFNINQIVKGTVNNLLNKEDELYNERIKICNTCKLRTINKVFGAICNPNLYLNPTTNETSFNSKPGFKSGCGCVLNSKTRVKEAKCPLGKW